MAQPVDPLAALDARIAELRTQAARANQALQQADHALRSALAERALLATAPPVAPAQPLPANGPETSTRTVQNILFVLGGGLLGIAAIVFTAVAWATYGVVGRAAILGVVTVLALAAPFVALARNLRATGETFAAVGLLLVLLDGYAIWYVNLFHVQHLAGARYVGLVLAVTAAFAFGYGRLTRLTGPPLVALVLAQPVAHLVAAPSRPSLAVVSLLASAVAAVDALVVSRMPRALRAIGWMAFGTAVATAGISALAAEAATSTVPDRALAGVALVAVPLVILLGEIVTGLRTIQAVAAGAVVVALVAAVHLTALPAWPGHGDLVYPAVTVAIALVVRMVTALLPSWVRPGPQWAVVGVVGAGLLWFAGLALGAAGRTVRAAQPVWDASLAPTGPHPPLLTWELPTALVTLTVAGLLAGPRWTYGPMAAGGLGLAVLSLPASTPLAWWAPPVLALAGVAVLSVGYLLVRRLNLPLLRESTLAGAGVLSLDAVLTSTARPGLTALVLSAIVALGVGVAVALRPQDVVGAGALAVGLLAAAPAVASALRWLDVAPWWTARAAVAVAAALLLALAYVRLRLPGRYLWAVFAAAVVSAAVWPLVTVTVGDEPAGVHMGVSLVLIAAALAVLPASDVRARYVAGVAALPAAVLLVAAAGPAYLKVSFYPYAWIDDVWAGRPAGVGLVPAAVGTPTPVQLLDAVALGLLAVAGALVTYAVRRRPLAALRGLGYGGPAAVLAAVVAADAPWPALPAATLLVGLLLVVVAALGPRSIVLAVQGPVYVGAGIAGTLALRWSTITSLVLVTVAFAVVAAFGRAWTWRAVGGVVAVAAATGAATAAGLAASMPLHQVAFVVVGVAAVALFAGALVRRNPDRRLEALGIEAAASGSALVALAYVDGDRGWTAALCALWGLALGGRALVPGIAPTVRAAHAVAGGTLEVFAWWLLLAARNVTVAEAYTLPLAVVALCAGWAALRARPELRSWVAYGPALLAGFLPTLAIVLTTDEVAWIRRLALGVAALGVVFAGAVRRRQAPVVVGGVVLILVALHELALVWQLLPGWIPLAAGGAILLFLAITYERRRRDLARLRSAITHMR